MSCDVVYLELTLVEAIYRNEIKVSAAAAAVEVPYV